MEYILGMIKEKKIYSLLKNKNKEKSNKYKNQRHKIIRQI